MKMHYTGMNVYSVQFVWNPYKVNKCVRLTEYLFWWALMWNRLYNYILWCFDWMCRFFYFFNFYFSTVWLWENEFCICWSLLLLLPPPPLLRKILMRNREIEWNNLFMKSLWLWLEYESKQVHGEKKRWDAEWKKNSKHVFALMVFNKQYLNVNYCDYFVWCAEINYFSLLVM